MIYKGFWEVWEGGIEGVGFECGECEIVGFERDCGGVMNEWVEIFCVRGCVGKLV